MEYHTCHDKSPIVSQKSSSSPPKNDL
jgi:hypothetical protein